VFKLNDGLLSIKGPKGPLEVNVHRRSSCPSEGQLINEPRNDDSTFADAMSGTTRALVNNMVPGVTKGFEKRLFHHRRRLPRRGARERPEPDPGYSHPVVYPIREASPSRHPVRRNRGQGRGQAKVGQVAPHIRSYPLNPSPTRARASVIRTSTWPERSQEEVSTAAMRP